MILICLPGRLTWHVVLQVEESCLESVLCCDAFAASTCHLQLMPMKAQQSRRQTARVPLRQSCPFLDSSDLEPQAVHVEYISTTSLHLEGHGPSKAT